MPGTPDSSYSRSTLPPGHPPVHEHLDGQCPITGNTHAYCPPQTGDVRSVCPALNTMANHGYMCVTYSLYLPNSYLLFFLAVEMANISPPAPSSTASKTAMVFHLLSLPSSSPAAFSASDVPHSLSRAYLAIHAQKTPMGQRALVVSLTSTS